MYFQKSRKRIFKLNNDILVLETKPQTRILFLIIFFMLLISFVISFRYPYDFTRPRLPGTLLFFLLTGVCLFLSLMKWQMKIDRAENVLIIQNKIIIFNIVSLMCPLGDVEKVLLRKTLLLKSGSKDSKFFPFKKREYIRLYIVLKKRRILIDSASSLLDLDETAKNISEFISVALSNEQD